MKRLYVPALLLLVAFTAGCPQSAPLYSMTTTNLGLSYPAHRDSFNDEGAIALWTTDPVEPAGLFPAVWKNGQLEPLPVNEDYQYGLLSITDSGAVVAMSEEWSESSSSSALVRWQDGEPTYFPLGGGTYSTALAGVSDSLQLAHSDYSAGGARLWDISGTTLETIPLATPEEAYVRIVDISDSGIALGTYGLPDDGSATPPHFCIWDDSGRKDLTGIPAGPELWPLAVNNESVVIGTTWVWRDGLLTFLDAPGSQYVIATDINNNGWIVGYAVMPDSSEKAVLWRPNGSLTSYDCTYLDSVVVSRKKLQVMSPYAINDHNEILAAAFVDNASDLVILKPFGQR